MKKETINTGNQRETDIEGQRKRDIYRKTDRQKDITERHCSIENQTKIGRQTQKTDKKRKESAEIQTKKDRAKERHIKKDRETNEERQ